MSITHSTPHPKARLKTTKNKITAASRSRDLISLIATGEVTGGGTSGAC